MPNKTKLVDKFKSTPWKVTISFVLLMAQGYISGIIGQSWPDYLKGPLPFIIQLVEPGGYSTLFDVTVLLASFAVWYVLISFVFYSRKKK